MKPCESFNGEILEPANGTVVPTELTVRARWDQYLDPAAGCFRNVVMTTSTGTEVAPHTTTELDDGSFAMSFTLAAGTSYTFQISQSCGGCDDGWDGCDGTKLDQITFSTQQ
ncbi:MAG: Ig-like domain-containing protein [Kofleriaceae bacterium]